MFLASKMFIRGRVKAGEITKLIGWWRGVDSQAIGRNKKYVRVLRAGFHTPKRFVGGYKNGLKPYLLLQLDPAHTDLNTLPCHRVPPKITRN